MNIRTAVIASLLLMAAGCQVPGDVGRPATRPATRPTTGPDEPKVTPGYSVMARPTGPSDGRPAVAAAVHLDVYVLDVPAETISRDEAFWRTVDEDAVGPAVDQRLQRNGIRCGVAQRAEWQRFAEIFRRELSRATRTKVDGLAGAATVELAVEQPAAREDLFLLTPDGQWEGHTYDHATNGLSLTFGPTPRTPGSVRLNLCPVVKCERRLLEFTPLNQAYETPTSDVARLYDVGLSVDVPADGFFIVAPSPNADPADLTVGGRFLVRRGPAARREQVLVCVPTIVPLNGTPLTVRQH